MSEQQDEKIGALWVKTSGRGEYMTGNIELKQEHIKALMDGDGKLQIVVFKNDKQTGNQPHWRILKSKPKGTAAPHVNDNRNVETVSDQDVPF